MSAMRIENAFIYSIAYLLKVLVPLRWRVTCDNLKRLHPKECVKSIAWQSYKHHARLMSYIPRLKSVVNNKAIEIVDNNHFKAMMKEKEVFLFSGHVGLWELVPFVLNKYKLKKQNWLYKHSRIKILDKLLFHCRQHPGINTWDSLTQLKDALKHFKTEGHLGLASDQGAGCQANFFGIPMKFPIGSQKLVDRYQVPCYFFCCMYKDDKIIVHVKPLKKESVQVSYIAELEAIIKQYPEQYYWMHRLWQV